MIAEPPPELAEIAKPLIENPKEALSNPAANITDLPQDKKKQAVDGIKKHPGFFNTDVACG